MELKIYGTWKEGHGKSKGGEDVMPGCAYHGFPGILLFEFLCLLSLCTLVMSGSPCGIVLLLALLMYDSTHASLLDMLLFATPTFS